MTKGELIAKVDGAKALVRQLGLWSMDGSKLIGPYSFSSKKVGKSGNHTRAYRTAIENEDYSFMLKDASIFQFSLLPEGPSFAFIQNPQKQATKIDYLQEIFGIDDLSEFSQAELREMENEISEQDFDQFLSEQDIILGPAYFRYDFDPKRYMPLVHSTAHLHIGLNSNTRIPLAVELDPSSFVLFVLRHTYVDNWIDSLDKYKTIILKNLESCKQKRIKLPLSSWHENEYLELHLT